MPGDKTHDLQTRTFERKEGLPKARDRDAAIGAGQPLDTGPSTAAGPSGTNRESRDHNKHNKPGQDGHKLQKHSPSEEKR